MEGFVDWSGRHVRLKYQLVITSILFFCSVFYDIKSIGIPGLVQFARAPDQLIVELALFLIFLFSLVSFIFRTVNEYKFLRSGNHFHKVVLQDVLSALKSVESGIKKGEVGVSESELLVLGITPRTNWKTSNGVNANSIFSKNELVSKIQRSQIEIDNTAASTKEFLTELKKQDNYASFKREKKELGLMCPNLYDEIEKLDKLFVGFDETVFKIIQLCEAASSPYKFREDVSSYFATAKTDLNRIRRVKNSISRDCRDDLTTLKNRDFSMNFEVNMLSIYIPIGASSLISLMALFGLLGFSI